MNRLHLFAAAALAASIPSIAQADIAFDQVDPNAYGFIFMRAGKTATFADVASPGYVDLLVNLTLSDSSVVQAVFDLSGTATSAATLSGAGTYVQQVSGSFSFHDAVTNEDYLTGNFVDAALTGSGKAGGLFGTSAGSVTYTSGSEANSTIGGFAISLENASRNFSASAGRPLNSFEAHISGTFNTVAAVPESSSWAMMIVGVFGLGGLLRRRDRQGTAALGMA